MKRALWQTLLAWKDHPLRNPLILRGPRQVGKSYLVEQLGKTFPNFVTINFERDPKAKALFQDSKEANRLIRAISAYTGISITPGETLLFFDEVQECEGAILSLRYFKEEMPALHVVAAGSLIDFALHCVGMPVGRVQFLYLHPLSFGEYLEALGKTELRRYLLNEPIEPAPHEKLLEELHHYCWLGGMPAVINAWREHQNAQYCQTIQDDILQAYRQDFEKYAKKHQTALVAQLFDQVGSQLGARFKYSKVNNSVRSQSLKEALNLLDKAGVVRIAYHTAAQGLPLSAEMDRQKFKVFFFDIGLLQRLQGLRLREWLLAPLSVTYLGAMAEQLVAQEYIAYSNPAQPIALYYWQREAKQSNAEVDFIFSRENLIIPAEVKSGSRGRLKSLALFLASHPRSTEGLVISENMPWQQENFQGLPLYALERWFAEAS
ncbi:MAG: hypothetical protein A3F10_07590 [Coxiella sp. RIFCSPHIGHO2_12_FULL_42_15]|nr:MAG: hypothetical protein A3F10_07590 [Coxiella sp. RIFCSPHIGHO2_12_FULL_42_15]